MIVVCNSYPYKCLGKDLTGGFSFWHLDIVIIKYVMTNLIAGILIFCTCDEMILIVYEKIHGMRLSSCKNYFLLK